MVHWTAHTISYFRRLGALMCLTWHTMAMDWPNQARDLSPVVLYLSFAFVAGEECVHSWRRQPAVRRSRWSVEVWQSDRCSKGLLPGLQNSLRDVHTSTKEVGGVSEGKNLVKTED